MAQVREITIYASGVVQDGQARDVSKCLGEAAAHAGKYMQAFDNYVDLPDRVNVPVRKYVRISDDEIQEKYVYENFNPEMVILMEEAMVKGLNVLRGMDPGGYLLVNSARSPQEILKFVPNKELLAAVGTVDVNAIAYEVSTDYMDSEGAAGSTAIGLGMGAAMAGAAAKMADLIKLDDVKAVVANPDVAQQAHDAVQIQTL